MIDMNGRLYMSENGMDFMAEMHLCGMGRFYR